MTKGNFNLLGIAAFVLALSGSGLVSAQENNAPEEAPDTRLVQINLLAASKSGDSDLSDLPANTRKAIEDIKDFLPFKSYRILDTSLVRALVSPTNRGSRPAKTFMTGPDGTKLQVELRMTGVKNSGEIYVHQFELAPTMRDRLFAVTTDPDVEADSGTPAIAPRADLVDMGALISTSFTAHLGQTVVVGSSRLNGGDEALIVLFTALP